MRLISKTQQTRLSHTADGTLVATVTRWCGAVLTPGGRIVAFDLDHDPTDDELAALQPATPRRLAPTAAVGKAALKDLLDEQLAQAQAWDWFSTRVALGGRPQAVKDAVASLALAEFAEAERLAVAWRQAV